MLFNGDGCDYRCRLLTLKAGIVEAEVLEATENRAESPFKITLSQAMSRGERMDYCLQKATELGVSAVQLLDSERVELKLAGARLDKRMAHWRGVMQSASEQCGRAIVPELRAPVSIGEWLAVGSPRQSRALVLDAGAADALSDVDADNEVDIAVGPEGGFSGAELASMKAAGVTSVRLGPRILRTETAGPAAIAVLQSLRGDFK